MVCKITVYLNPTDHAWDMLQKAISSRQVQSATVRELGQGLASSPLGP